MNTIRRSGRAPRRTVIGLFLVGLLTVGVSALPRVGGLAPAPAAAAPVFAAYHDASSATHQSQFDTLSAAGYRMISLSTYGSVSSPRFAAVWVKRSGPAWKAFHDATAAQVNSFHTANTAAGYRPVLLSATGSATDPRYAGVWEKNYRSTTYTLAATRATLDSMDASARASRGSSAKLLKSVDVYGAPGTSQRFAIIQDANTARVNHAVVPEKTIAASQSWFNGLTAGGFRPTHTTTGVSGAGPTLVTQVWNDSRIGAWYSRVNLTSAEYQSAFNDASANGYYPIQVDGAVIGGTTRLSAIFAKADQPLGRTMSVRGSYDSRLAAFDTWMKNYLQSKNLRAGSLAIAKGGKLVYARGFTWAESGYPITQPTSTFRIASSSKPLTAMTAMRLVDEGKLTQATKMQSVLGITQPNGAAPYSTRWSDVTLDHLLCQSSGLNTGFHMFQDEAVAAAYDVGYPVTVRQNAGWASSKSVPYAPGTHADYINGNFTLAGMMNATKYGASHEAAVRAKLFTPLGVTRPRVGKNLASERLPGEVLYDTPVAVNGGTGDTQVAVSSVTAGKVPVARSYGGWNQANLDAAGGWVLAPADWVKVLSSFHDGNSPLFKDVSTRTGVVVDQKAKTMWSVCNSSVSSNGERGWYRGTHTKSGGGSYTFHEHNGSLPSNSFLVVHSGELSFALGFNRRTDPFLYGTVEGEAIMDIADGIGTWPTWDLFTSVGIPAN